MAEVLYTKRRKKRYSIARYAERQLFNLFGFGQSITFTEEESKRRNAEKITDTYTKVKDGCTIHGKTSGKT